MSFRGALATKNLGYIPFMLPRFFASLRMTLVDVPKWTLFQILRNLSAQLQE